MWVKVPPWILRTCGKSPAVRESIPLIFFIRWADVGLALPGGATSWLPSKRREMAGTTSSSISASATSSRSAEFSKPRPSKSDQADDLLNFLKQGLIE
jgi:hypothetical protein